MKKTRTVKAWAVVGYTGKISAFNGFKPDVYFDEVDAIESRYGNQRVVPCTITYQLPNKKK